MSGPQRQCSGAPQRWGPVGSPSALGHRQVDSWRWGSVSDRSTGRLWRWGADLSAPQQIVVGEPTGRLSGVGEQISALGHRQVD